MMLTITDINQVANQGPYYPNWQSLNQFSVPKWFKQAKFGVFIHWGLYSIPAFNNEWYSRNMYIQDHPEFQHHIETYGQHLEFGYKDFIPMFDAEKFDADFWIRTFRDAGAQYLFQVAEHHDGFQLYNSDYSQFTSVNMGPKRDILKEIKEAAEKYHLDFCVSSHRAEHWFFMGHGKEFDSDIKEPLKKGDFYWPAMPEPDNQDLFSRPYPNQEFLEDWLLRTCELIDRYQPKALYFDWWIQHDSFKEYLQILCAFYYNRGVEWQTEVAICYKHDAFMFGTAIPEIERGKFSDAQPFYWQTDTAIARNSWCYTTTLDYKTSKEIIHNLIEVVSKNGNLLLNVGPKGDGSIPEKDLEILQEIGDWLRVNGEAIYGSKIWRKSGEGPTKIKSGQFQEERIQTYTSQDIRFTVNGDSIYAFLMEATSNSEVTIQSLADSEDQNAPKFHGIIDEVELLGIKETVKWKKTTEGLIIKLPEFAITLPIVCKIKIR